MVYYRRVGRFSSGGSIFVKSDSPRIQNNQVNSSRRLIMYSQQGLDITCLVIPAQTVQLWRRTEEVVAAFVVEV